MLEPIARIGSSVVVIAQPNIDTDQLIPARFMTTTSSSGLGKSLLFDARHDMVTGRPNAHVLNQVDAAAHQVLVAGANFGCGSSREHAVWALTDFGFRVVLAPQMADIFRANALNNGLLAIDIDDALYWRLAAKPGQAIAVDLDTQTISVEGAAAARFAIDPFARHCLMHGIDRLQFLLGQLPAIELFEQQR